MLGSKSKLIYSYFCIILLLFITYCSIHETVASFVSSTIKRHRTIFGKIKIKQKIHSLDDILVVINVNNQRILRNNANLVEQINNYDMLWLVTEFEWKQFTQENLEVKFLNLFIQIICLLAYSRFIRQ